MNWLWFKEFSRSYMVELLIKLLIILTIFYWAALHFALVVAFKFDRLKANWLKFFKVCREEWSAATKESCSERAAFKQLMLMEQNEMERE